MTRVRHSAVAALLIFAFAGSAFASWYDDYDAGLAAARNGNWAVVIQKMSAAIKGNPKENNKAKTYGTIFYNYHPYYYRGIAYMNTGKYEQAISDLETTMGPGALDLGPIGENLRNAKSRLEAAAAPAPESRPQPAVQVPVPVQSVPVPAAPVIDASLRQRATAAINAARQRLAAAQQRRAGSSPQYTEAVANLTKAMTTNAAPKSNDDLNEVIAMAESAGSLADLASAPVLATTTPAAPALTPKSVAASDAALADYKLRMRKALEQYFAGEFDVAARQFEMLSREMPDNAWVFAFLGAAQYSRYAFEGDERARSAAEDAFRRAKRLRTWKNGLPQNYFSKRIRRAFSETAG